MKKLKALAVILIILLIGLIVLGSNLNTFEEGSEIVENPKVDLTKENVSEVINSGGSILEFNGYVYYINVQNSSEKGFNNKICRRKLEDNSIEEVVYEAGQYKLEDRLIVFNNNLFFSMAGQTFFINLDDLNMLSAYNKGVLYSIQDGKIIYVHQSKIYRGEYYEATLAIRNFNAIATVTPIFMLEDDANLYFYSSNEDGSKSIFCVNKASQSLKILDRVYLGDSKKLEIIDYTQSDDNIYIVFEKTSIRNSKEQIIRRIAKDANGFNSVAIDGMFESFASVSSENAYFKLNGNANLYKYDDKSDGLIKIDVSEENKNVYTLKLNGKNVELYNNVSLMATILRSAEHSISNVNIEEIGEYIYLKFELVNAESSIEEFMFWRLKKDGSNLERFNNTF